MLIGYMRVSKADGSQAAYLQRDALIEAGVDPTHIYEDQASGKREDRSGHQESGPRSQCWEELSLYRTRMGQWVFQEVYRTVLPGRWDLFFCLCRTNQGGGF
jgi:hypothetical protein